MTGAWDTITPYNRGFREFSAAYEAFGFEDIHRGSIPYLPKAPGLMLDIGAGSGRDAAWFASRNWDVIAVEPASFMRDNAKRTHASDRIRWIDDSLPGLSIIHGHGLVFDLVWISGVWMHVPPVDRPRAMRKIAMLLKPGGRLVITLRHGPGDESRPMWPVNANEVERLGLDMGLALRVATDFADDLGGRPGVKWQTLILDLPDDGAGALPLLRGVILNQEKSATYKLALLRCIARIADGSPNVAREGPDFVELPLGLVALYWIRMFKPLVERGLPQRTGSAMGFVKDAFRALRVVAPYDLRPGMVFTNEVAEALRRALSETARLIAAMPATHLTFADNSPVFPTRYGRLPKPSTDVVLDLDYLWQFGTTRIPLNIWNALRRMAAWIEPMLIAEWTRLTKMYAGALGLSVTTDQVVDALEWLEPARDTNFVRDIAQRHLARGEIVRCVWSGTKLFAEEFDVDHCLPWSAWPCEDLWNLVPSTQTINRHRKAERIVSSQALSRAKPLILEWWQHAYLEHSDMIRMRFTEEAQTTLPLARSQIPNLEELFQALDFRRLRLRQETQAREWDGPA